MDTNDKLKVVVVISILILVIYIVWRILGKLGIVTSSEAQKKQESVDLFLNAEYFNPEYAKGKSFKSIGGSVANQYAKDIKEAVLGFGSNEELIYSTFSKLKNKCNVSEVAEAYYQLRQRDLKADLKDELRESEIETLMKIVSKLPEY